ncbi:MAG TPA: molybdate ABC transporter substrate-binding protein [Coleofasciculaceae cyanobacterium]
MNQTRLFPLIVWFFIAFIAVVGCTQAPKNASSPTSTAQAQPINLTISAAASLKDALQSIQPVYTQQKPNVTLTYNFGASGALQQQIEQGAPVDVFISAAEKQMNALQGKNLLLTDTRNNLLKNTVVLIVPKNSTGISDFKDLSSDKVRKIAIGDPQSVPAGQYGKEVLSSLKLFDPVKTKLVFAKDVRQVLSYVETGNTSAGLVYGTDAKISDKVRVVATAPEDSHSPIIYPVAVLKRSKNPEAAKEFVQFLSSEPAKGVFEQYGFSMAR